ncbi:hypothetical protein CEXT_591161 [Caerostris extrusa]|uniref:Uncharacterized protein n=1 Tax=Caerostris extrusa TaxID=172846 RepID=A0AAV4N2H6_CAEEX|nr:hypothetical protein CEXT_591161 [Caerostris extrusa]
MSYSFNANDSKFDETSSFLQSQNFIGGNAHDFIGGLTSVSLIHRMQSESMLHNAREMENTYGYGKSIGEPDTFARNPSPDVREGVEASGHYHNDCEYGWRYTSVESYRNF